MTDNIVLAPAREQLALLEKGEISSAELMETYLERIETHNPGLDAIVTLDADGARRPVVRTASWPTHHAEGQRSRPGESIRVGSTFRLSHPGNSARCRVVLADPPHRLHWLEVADDGLAVSVEFSISPDEVGGTMLTHTKSMLRHGAIAEPPTGTRHYR
jgi:hypothetical protein